MRTCVVRWPHHAVTFRRSGGLHAGARWCMEPRLGRGVPCAKPRQAMRRCNEAQRVSERARLPGCVAQRVYLYAWPHAHALYLTACTLPMHPCSTAWPWPAAAVAHAQPVLWRIQSSVRAQRPAAAVAPCRRTAAPWLPPSPGRVPSACRHTAVCSGVLTQEFS